MNIFKRLSNNIRALQNIDDNAYFYQNPLSSKISSILDYTGSSLGYKANSGTYAYDANGNTTYDPANKIATIYNYLNLPSKFTKDDGSKQELVYDFSGKKWQENEFLVNGDTLSKRSYLGSFEFEGNSLQKAFHPAGFIQNLVADVNSGGQSNGNIIGSNIVSTQKLINGGKSEYLADKSICLLPGFESLPIFNAEIKPQAGFQWNYILKDHLGNKRVLFTDKNNDGLIRQDPNEPLNEVLSVSNYSPFGLELGGSHQNFKWQFDYKFQGKQDNGFAGLTDFGARWLDKGLGVWGQIDPLAEKYFSQSSRNFTHLNPVNAIDPDGRLVIFVNGQGPSRPLNDYWGGFDLAVNKRLHDFHNQYYDGSIGGWGSTAGGGIFTGLGNNLKSGSRYQAGFEKGYEDAAHLIANLSRDKKGNIIETIKIITHSMGGVFGSGIQNGILKYLSEHPELARQVRISLVAHFDPFQGNDITADKNIFTMQFLHKNAKGRENTALGLLANEEINGYDKLIEDKKKTGHGITTFLSDIKSLQQGTYIWNGNNWECTNCK